MPENAPKVTKMTAACPHRSAGACGSCYGALVQISIRRSESVKAAQADAAGWKKGVEDANRLTQEHAARADQLQRELDEERPAHAQFAADAYARIAKLEGELDAARRTEVLLREVLDESRRYVAAHIRLEEAELRGRECEHEALTFHRNDALQRLRDTLRETRPALLGAAGKGA